MDISMVKQIGEECDKGRQKPEKSAVPDIGAAKRVGTQFAGLSEPPNTPTHSAEEA